MKTPKPIRKQRRRARMLFLRGEGKGVEHWIFAEWFSKQSFCKNFRTPPRIEMVSEPLGMIDDKTEFREVPIHFDVLPETPEEKAEWFK